MRDLEEQLRAYGTVLDRADATDPASVAVVAPARGRRSFVVAVALVVTVVAIIAVTVRAARSTSSPRPKIVTPGPEPSPNSRQPSPTLTAAPNPNALHVVAQFGVQDPVAHPFAFAAGRVWVAHGSPVGSQRVVIDGYDPSSAHLETTITVPQVGGVAVAGQGDTLWVSSGAFKSGMPGVPDLAVSRVDARDGTVLFTTALGPASCACPVVAGSAGVWLVGNRKVLRLSPSDGHVIAEIAIDVPATAAIEARGRLLVGLDDGTIDVIDPATNSIERTIPRPVVGDAPVEWVTAMTPASVPAIGSDPPIDAFVARENGSISVLPAGGWQVNELYGADFQPSSIVNVGPDAWMFGGSRLYITTTHAVVSNEFVNADGRFTRVQGSLKRPGVEFGDALAANGTVWCIMQDNGYRIAVLSAPTPFPFG
jgi:hypothetical protein